MDWHLSRTGVTEYIRVSRDASGFHEGAALDGITGFSIERNLLADLKVSGSIDYVELPDVGNDLVRIYYTASNDTGSERVALATMFVATSGYDQVYTSEQGTADLYSTLRLLASKKVRGTLTIPAGTVAISYAASIITGIGLPCHADTSTAALTSAATFTAENGDSYLSVLNYLTDFAGFSSAYPDASGAICLDRYADPSSRTATVTFSDREPENDTLTPASESAPVLKSRYRVDTLDIPGIAYQASTPSVEVPVAIDTVTSPVSVSLSGKNLMRGSNTVNPNWIANGSDSQAERVTEDGYDCIHITRPEHTDTYIPTVTSSLPPIVLDVGGEYRLSAWIKMDADVPEWPTFLVPLHYHFRFCAEIPTTRYVPTDGKSAGVVSLESGAGGIVANQWKKIVLKIKVDDTAPDGYPYPCLRSFIYGKTGSAVVNNVWFRDYQIESSTTATDWEPYSGTTLSITLPTDHAYLASLPDGTKDTLDVRADGVAVLTERVGKIASYAGETVTGEYISTTGALTTGATIYYAATATTLYSTDGSTWVSSDPRSGTVVLDWLYAQPVHAMYGSGNCSGEGTMTWHSELYDTGDTRLEWAEVQLHPETDVPFAAKIAYAYDVFDVANVVVEVCSSAEDGAEPLISVATNDDPDSPFSTVSRGYEIPLAETQNDVESQAALDAIAAAKLLAQSSNVESVEVQHPYTPEFGMGDVANIDYTSAGKRWVMSAVSQTIKSSALLDCTTKFRRFVRE